MNPKLPSLHDQLVFFAHRLTSHMPVRRVDSFLEFAQDFKLVLSIYPPADLPPYARWIMNIDNRIREIFDALVKAIDEADKHDMTKAEKNATPEMKLWRNMKVKK